LALNTKLGLQEATALERLSQRPPRYSEASLVRKLEELGIGRPSTYAPTISTIQRRGYVIKGNKDGVERDFTILSLKNGKISNKIKKEIVGADRAKLMPTDIGLVVNDFLTEYFPSVLDYSFTADIEKELDRVAEGKETWTHAIDNFYQVFHPKVEEVTSVKTEHKVGERILGTDPKSGKQVSVKIGRYGPFVQIGHADDEKKPQFASLTRDQSIETIDLEEALKLFDLPRLVGEIDGKPVTAAIGRFGPFVRYENSFTTIPKDLNPLTITIDEARRIIEEKKEKDAKKVIKTFADDDKLQVLNGRFGPYIAYDGGNYKLPKGKAPADLTHEECMQIIQDTADKKPAGKTASKAKATKAKATGTKAKKTTAKK
jgi:DNA topoisomerase-1